MSFTLILASSSPYRRQLLERLRVPFRQQSPGIDETRRSGEPPREMVQRLAREKAAALAADDRCWVLGSDQVAVLDDEVLGKPGDHPAAMAQLQRCSGQEIRFLTAVCLADAQRRLEHVDVTRVVFRELDPPSIERYLEAEQPYDCAGSFKAEGLGISLFSAIHSEDPTALIGLPLISVARMLRDAGFEVP